MSESLLRCVGRVVGNEGEPIEVCEKSGGE